MGSTLGSNLDLGCKAELLQKRFYRVCCRGVKVTSPTGGPCSLCLAM